MIQIDVVSDVACPWCYIGMKRLEKALASIPEIETEISWQPFELDPNIPTEGRLTKPYFEAKFGSEEKVQEIFEHMKNVGESEGIAFNFQKMNKTMNSLALHVLMHKAEEEGFKTELKHRFFKAYFEEVIDLSEPQNLLKIMAEYGWSETNVLDILNDKKLQIAVKDKIKFYQSKGVSAVPFFIFNDKYGVSGAQPPKVLADTIRQINSEMIAETAIVGSESCDTETGEC
jgi:predicted DsbA family dithiol-disulfide isomerase